MADKNKVLVYLANGIGNCILCIPALKSLTFVTDSVDLCIPEDWPRAKPLIDLFKGQEFVTRLFTNTDDIAFNSYSKIFIPAPQERTGMRTVLERQPQAVVFSHPDWRESVSHEAEFFMHMPRLLGYSGRMPSPEISIAERVQLPYEKYFVIAFSCLEGHPWENKRWPIENWIGLVRILLDRFSEHGIVFVGASSDSETAAKIINNTNLDRVHSFCGKATITESGYVISKSQCMITVDNGLSHLAAAVNAKKLVVLYGATLLSKNIPLHRDIVIVKSNEDCVPCYATRQFRACTDNKCMKNIDPYVVLETVESIIGPGSQSSQLAPIAV